MSTSDVTALVEQLSESAVLADPTDLPLLADMHTGFESLAAWAAEAGRPRGEACARAAAGLVEAVILDEAGDARAALEVVGRAVSAFQLAAAGGHGDDEIEYPAALLTEAAPAASAFIFSRSTTTSGGMLARLSR